MGVNDISTGKIKGTVSRPMVGRASGGNKAF